MMNKLYIYNFLNILYIYNKYIYIYNESTRLKDDECDIKSQQNENFSQLDYHLFKKY